MHSISNPVEEKLYGIYMNNNIFICINYNVFFCFSEVDIQYVFQ